MNRRYAHVSRIALAVLAAAATVWLSAFFLPGAVVEPIPLLPSIGSAAGKVVDVPALTKKKHVTPKRSRFVVAPAQLASVTSLPQAVQARPERRSVQRRRAAQPRRHAPRPKHSAPVEKAAPAPTTASTAAAPVSFDSAPRGRAVGWHRKHDQPTASAPAPAAPQPQHGNGHAKHNAPPVQPAPAPVVPVAPPPGPTDGHDNGKHLGDEHGNGGQGHGPGDKQ